MIASIEVSYFLVFKIDILLKNRFLWLCKSLEMSDFTRTDSRSESAKAKWTNKIWLSIPHEMKNEKIPMKT